MFIGAILAKFLRPSAIMKISEKVKRKNQNQNQNGLAQGGSESLQTD